MGFFLFGDFFSYVTFANMISLSLISVRAAGVRNESKSLLGAVFHPRRRFGGWSDGHRWDMWGLLYFIKKRGHSFIKTKRKNRYWKITSLSGDRLLTGSQ